MRARGDRLAGGLGNGKRGVARRGRRPQQRAEDRAKAGGTAKLAHLSRVTNAPAYQTSGQTVIQRSTYSLAGQAIAMRVAEDPIAANNGLFYLNSDHLGSASAIVTSGGQKVNETRYLPFGGYRSGGPNALTDRGFTGQKENMELGLLYYNARFYAPGLGRFLSADSIVPDPTNPQSLNRYSYTRNSPLNLIDPTGHRECGASDDCSEPLPHTSGFQEALLNAWNYYEDNFDLPFEGSQNITEGFGPSHDGVDYGGGFSVHAPAEGEVVQDRFRDPPAGMWMIQNRTTGDILTWSRWRTDPGWQGELYESDRGSDGLLEPERLLQTGEWEDIRDGNPNTEANWSHSSGTMIQVNHAYGLATTYIHTVPALTVGQQVQQGDILGEAANNGWSSGTHLHYRLEFTYSGRTIYLNPLTPPRQIVHLLP